MWCKWLVLNTFSIEWPPQQRDPAYPACSLWQSWSSSAPRWPGCTGDLSCRSGRAGSESQQAGGCLGPDASPAAPDTPGNPPTPVCNFLGEREAATTDHLCQPGDEDSVGCKAHWVFDACLCTVWRKNLGLKLTTFSLFIHTTYQLFNV